MKRLKQSVIRLYQKVKAPSKTIALILMGGIIGTLTQEYTLPAIKALISFLFSWKIPFVFVPLMFIIGWALPKLNKMLTTPKYRMYRMDVIDELLWVWQWSDNNEPSISNGTLLPRCLACDADIFLNFYRDDLQFADPVYNRRDKKIYAWCPKCQIEDLLEHRRYERLPEYKEQIAREVTRRARMGEFKPGMKRDEVVKMHVEALAKEKERSALGTGKQTSKIEQKRDKQRSKQKDSEDQVE